MNDYLLMASISIIDFFAVILCLVVMFTLYKVKPTCRRIAIVVMMVGVFSQAVQSGMFVITERMPLYTEFPLWLLKDFGFLLLMIGYILERKK